MNMVTFFEKVDNLVVIVVKVLVIGWGISDNFGLHSFNEKAKR